MRPEAVVNDDKNIMTLAYGNMMGLMVEALKEAMKGLEEIVKR